MLIELSVRNLAIFEDVRVPFAPGMNVVTGETGAGKSILVEAIRLALGEKADPMAVRSGEEEAEVFALFDLSGREDLSAAWEETGLPWEDEVVLRRVIPASGRSRAYLNGRMVSQAVLAELSPLLLEMVGQHSVHSLLSRSAALSAIDAFCGTVPAAAEMRRRYRAVSSMRRELQEAAAGAESARRKAGELDEAIAELTRASLVPGEEEEVSGELSLIRNAAKVVEALRAAEEALAASEHSSSVSLSFAAARLREAVAADPKVEDAARRARALAAEAQELARDISSRLSRVEVAADRRERLEERLSAIRRLKRKYGLEVPELLAHLERIREERGRQDEAVEGAKRMEEALRGAEAQALGLAQELSRARGAGAKRLGKAVEEELARVDLPGAVFRALLESRPADPGALSASGLDEADFLFGANRGLEPRPLAQSASGGELSRVMLALRNASARGRGRTTMVFDEIDTGIGGKVAELVGARLKALGQAAQVVCVTHLPQVAAFADSHLLVVKGDGKEAAATVVKPLSKQDRIKELARMISGAQVTPEARGHARELIERASKG